MVGIYKITNPKGKIYIGQSINIEERLYQYKCLSKYSLGKKIFNSIQKYGWENHTHEVITECSVEDLDTKEIYWGKFYNTLGENGLNLKLGEGRGIVSEETKKKMSESAKRNMTKEHRQKLSQAQIGKKKSEEHKQKMRVPKKSNKNYLNNVGKWEGPTRATLQYDKEGNFIAEYRTIKEAEIKFHPKGKWGNNIVNCCSGNQKTAYGYVWKYKS